MSAWISLLKAEDGTEIRFSNVTGIVGHSLVTYRQGKKRAGVNWDQVSVNWEISANPAVRGTLKIKEYYSDFPEDIEFDEVRVQSTGDGSSGSLADVRRTILSCRPHFSLILGKLVEGMMGIKSGRTCTSQGTGGSPAKS